MSETPDPIQPQSEATAAIAAALSHMPVEQEPSSLGKFFKGFFIVWACLCVLGEMMYDGDFHLGRDTPTGSIIRACNTTFRAHPILGAFKADVSLSATAFDGADAVTALKVLQGDGFALTDETQNYAGQMAYNDGVIEGTRDASHLWPEFLRKDTCDVKVLIRSNRVAGVTAEAIRIARAEPVLQAPNAATAPVLNAAKEVGEAVKEVPGMVVAKP